MISLLKLFETMYLDDKGGLNDNGVTQYQLAQLFFTELQNFFKSENFVEYITPMSHDKTNKLVIIDTGMMQNKTWDGFVKIVHEYHRKGMVINQRKSQIKFSVVVEVPLYDEDDPERPEL
jgi:hypothetical protein